MGRVTYLHHYVRPLCHYLCRILITFLFRSSSCQRSTSPSSCCHTSSTTSSSPRSGTQHKQKLSSLEFSRRFSSLRSGGSRARRLVSLGRLLTIRGCCGERYVFSYFHIFRNGLLTGSSSRGISTTNGNEVYSSPRWETDDTYVRCLWIVALRTVVFSYMNNLYGSEPTTSYGIPLTGKQIKTHTLHRSSRSLQFPAVSTQYSLVTK